MKKPLPKHLHKVTITSHHVHSDTADMQPMHGCTHTHTHTLMHAHKA